MIQAIKFSLPELANLFEYHCVKKRSFFFNLDYLDLSEKRNRGIYCVEGGDREAESG